MENTSETSFEFVDVASTIRSIYTPNLFAGKTALVTGGSRGIGRAICVALGALGARVLINYSGNQKAAEETLLEIQNAQGEGRLVQFDVSNFQQVQDTLKTLEKEMGAIDIIVNNAGVAKDNLFVKMKEEEWDANIDTNLKGAFNCSRALAMSMLRRRSGKIINISSVVGLMGNGGQSAYAASKAGIFGLTKSLALEFASRNVQVNAVAPGYMVTDMTNSLGGSVTDQIRLKIPAQKLGDPVEIAKAVVFLASPASPYITGQTLAVDGGMTMY